MKITIIVIHCIGITAGLAIGLNFTPHWSQIMGFLCAASNGLGAYLSAVYKTGDPNGGLSVDEKLANASVALQKPVESPCPAVNSINKQNEGK